MRTFEPPLKGTALGALLLVCLGFVFFSPLFFGDSLLFPVHTSTYPPWQGELSPETLQELEKTSNSLMADKVHIFHPELVKSRRSLSSCELPLWDPYTLGGIPHLAQGLPATFHLVNAGYLFMRPEAAYAVTAFLQTVLAAIFMLLFLRSLEIRLFPAFAGGLVFGFSGWMLIHLHYFQITGAAMWLPLLLLCIEKIARKERAWWILALAAGVFQTLCAGFPQIAVMNLYIAAAYAVLKAAPFLSQNIKTGLGILLKAGSGILVGILLSGIQFIPTVETALSGEFTREMGTKEVIRERDLPLPCLLTYIAPDLFGHPELTRKTSSPYFRHSSLLSLATLPRQDERPDVNYTETHGYIGTLPLILALLAFFIRPRKGWLFFAAILGFSLCTALGVPGFIDLTAILPGLMIGDAKRFLFPAAFGLTALAAFALDKLLKPDGPRVALIFCSGAVVGAVLIVAGVWTALTITSDDGLRHAAVSAVHAKTNIDAARIEKAISTEDLAVQREFLSSVLLRTVMQLMLAGGALLLFMRQSRHLEISRPFLAIVLVLDLFTVGSRFNEPVVDLPLYDEGNEVVGYLMENTKFQRIVRYENDLLYPVNSGTIHRIRDMQGYTAFYSKRYRRLLDLLEPGRSQAYGGACLLNKETLSSPILDLMSVKHILAVDRQKLPGVVEVFHKNNVFIHENTGSMPLAYLHQEAVYVDSPDKAAELLSAEGYDPWSSVIIEQAAGSAAGEKEKEKQAGQASGLKEARGGVLPATIKRYEDEEVEIEVERGGPGWLVLNDNFCSGWIAELDGKEVPILHANLAFRAVRIPDADPHRVRFEYVPQAVWIGKCMSFAGLAICLVLAVFFWKRQ